MSAALGWALAVVGGVLVAWLAYPTRTAGRLRPLLIALRVASVGLILALVLDLAVGASRPAPALVALDVSASWGRSADAAAWQSAIDSAKAATDGAGELTLFGDSSRNEMIPSEPGDAASRVSPVLTRAGASGRRVVIVTDGAIDDAEALQGAVAGSRVITIPTRVAPDRALVELSAPPEARAGDTVTLQVRIVAAGNVATPATIRWALDAAPLGEATVPSMSANAEMVIDVSAVIPPGDSIAVLRAALGAGGDGQPRNDSIAIPFRRGARQRVVIVSTAPDADVRDVAATLRANVTFPTDVFYRIAPNRWLRDGSFAPVAESVVRTAVRGATLAVLHGDTLAMGAPSSLGTRALLLLSPPAGDAQEMLVRAAPASPLQGALAGIVVESLPPLLVSTPARGGVPALAASKGLASGAGTPIVSATDGAVRRVLITGAGYSRWRARGGVSELAFQALLGASTDWLLGARGQQASPALVGAVQRAGAPLRWRRGARAVSIVTLTRDGDQAARRDSLVFPDVGGAVTPPLPAGTWRGTVDGAAIVVPVSVSREWLPRTDLVRSAELNGAAVSMRRAARSISWLYLMAVLLLATEWLLRRRAGLR